MGTAFTRHFTRSVGPRGSPLGLALSLLLGLGGALGCGSSGNGPSNDELVAQGKQIFRFDTFGDETKWTDTLRMNEVDQPRSIPTTALAVGLKVDAEALPPRWSPGIQNGTIDLTRARRPPSRCSSSTRWSACKGTVETVNGKDTLTRVGITCALCHSTVDNSFAPGIGKRLDGWPNRDLNSGAIIALSPGARRRRRRRVFNSWGPGKYDPRFNIDGQNKPAVIPPAYGLAGVHSITVTGDGDEIAYWNRYVAVTQMGGHGTFTEPRLGVTVTNGTEDLVEQQAAGAAGLPALARRAGAARRQLRRRPRPRAARRCSTARAVRDLPQRAASSPTPTRACIRRPTRWPSRRRRATPRARATKQYRTAPLQGRLAARAVLPRRLGRDARATWCSDLQHASARSG